jgi:hypothetical protein
MQVLLSFEVCAVIMPSTWADAARPATGRAAFSCRHPAD